MDWIIKVEIRNRNKCNLPVLPLKSSCKITLAALRQERRYKQLIVPAIQGKTESRGVK